ncbi:hypothetical protein [Jeongeupia sp. USM3]|uniref:hypothetical protein n=1 Tax=Jeongeupia sp. USM3 TaxID=1906741 RepID=UPI00089DED1E|nr:hypothetical protein [Jeongeupia sp. USM3]AOY01828.1 hypothetical protein BJP62_16050 [Jeongeupia sp. USM3]
MSTRFALVRRWFALALMCLLPWQPLYAAAASMHAPAAVTAPAHRADGHHASPDAHPAHASCDDAHCAACVPPVADLHQTMTTPTLAPVLVAAIPRQPADIDADPARKPPRR